MDNFKVNIYIETSSHGPATRNGSYGYVIEYFLKSGEPVTREGFGSEENTTENKMVLMALCEAIQRLQKPCSIRVFTECNHVLNAFSGFWIRQWQENDWKNAKGKPVKNSDLWEKLLELLNQHVITLTNEEDEYRTWIKNELEKGRKA